MNSKKVILISLVLVELVVSIAICGIGYKHLLSERQKKQAQFAAVIKKDQIIQDTSKELKYYYDLKPNLVVEDHPSWLPYIAHYTINNDGLNERFNYPVEKSVNTFRIIALGDSFTFGHYVNTPDNWTEKLEDLLNSNAMSCQGKKFEVINLGMRGFDIPYIVERYRAIGAKYNPDLILWLESGSGFVKVNELQLPLVQKCDDLKVANHTKTDDPTTMYDCYSQAITQVQQKYSREQMSNYLSAYIDRFLSDAGNRNVTFYTFEELNTQLLNELKTWTQQGKQVTISAEIPELWKVNGLLPDGHPNVKGHQAIANTIFNDLRNNDLRSLCGNTQK